MVSINNLKYGQKLLLWLKNGDVYNKATFIKIFKGKMLIIYSAMNVEVVLDVSKINWNKTTNWKGVYHKQQKKLFKKSEPVKKKKKMTPAKAKTRRTSVLTKSQESKLIGFMNKVSRGKA